MVTGRRISAALLAACLLILPGCTEVDDAVQDVGAIQLFVANRWPTPIISSAPINGRCSTRNVASDPGTGLQSSMMSVSVAELTVGGETLDLVAGDDVCAFQNTTFGATANGICSSGLTAAPIPEGSTGTVRIVMQVEARRLEPLDLPLDGTAEFLNGFGDDGLATRLDACPLIGPEPNPNPMDPPPTYEETLDPDTGVPVNCQATSPLTLITTCDSDADGISDDADNCFYFANPSQQDDIPTSDLPWITGDRVGNACPVQIARLQVSGQTTIELEATLDNIGLTERTVGFIVVDLGGFNDLQCNWAQSPTGVCVLDPSAISISFTN